jgi:hypothetical protein
MVQTVLVSLRKHIKGSYVGDPDPDTLQSQNRGLSPNFHIHVSVSELYIPRMGLSVLLEEICRLILGIYKSLEDT